MAVLTSTFSLTTHFVNKPPLVCKSIAMASLVILFMSSCGSGGSGQEADPLAPDEPVAYVKRPVPTDEDGNIESEDILLPDAFNGGGRLYIRDRSSQSASERNITDAVFGAGAEYDVKDIEVSYSGEKLLFSMRPPQIDNADEEDQPKWRLWEYSISENSLTKLLPQTDDITDQFHDISPAYLPDGRIVFSSSRQLGNQVQLRNSGIRPYRYTVDDDIAIFNLHVFDPVNDPAGNFIQQITFSQGHDLQPTLLSNGRIAFLRYENSEENRNNGKLSLYTINIDGSDMQLHYGYHSQTTGNSTNQETTFVDVRELPNGMLSAILQQRDAERLGGNIISIDANNFIDINQPTNENSGDTGSAQRTLTVGTVNLDDGISTHGYFNSAYPLGNSRFLVSWNPCRLLDDNDTAEDTSDDIILACNPDNLADATLEEAPPFFGLWIYDTSARTQTPVATASEGQMFTDAVLMKSRSAPPIAEANLDEELEDRNLGILHIRSVYDVAGDETATDTIRTYSDPTRTPASARPARFLRIIKPVGMPSDEAQDLENAAFGISTNRGMREILGYTPIEPDGSVRVAVPADVSFYFDIVNADGERISDLHINYLQVRAGETFECLGCHVGGTNGEDTLLPHGRRNAEAVSANLGASGVGTHFINTAYTNINGVNDGDTMAEVYALANEAERTLTTDIIFSDDWSNTPEDPFSYTYASLLTDPPATENCQTEWTADCRTVINYEEHIQPLWDLTRDGNSCISCHNTTNADGNLQTPAAQLVLNSTPSTQEAEHYYSYRALLGDDSLPQILHPDGTKYLTLFAQQVINDVEQYYEFDDGTFIGDIDGINGDRIPLAVAFNENQNDLDKILLKTFGTNEDNEIVELVYRDPNGAVIPDANGQPIPIMRQINSDPNEPDYELPPEALMRLSNSAGSDFFDRIQDTTLLPDHSGFMSQSELRLLREWLDIGGQYFNDPFDPDVPIDED